jgi:lysophospholipase L1-like esterase
MRIALAIIATALALPNGMSSPIRLVVAGDSTASNWPASGVRRGWGQFIQQYFDPDGVRVINHAVSGCSTKTFISLGFWQKVMNEKPDFVLIQFGHNDSHDPKKPESTDAKTDYKDYLRRFVDETRAAGATPVLVTPMFRRRFGPDGKLIDGLLPYVTAMKEVAAQRNVALVDLHAASGALFERLGPKDSAALGDSADDATHFNEKGARAMADLVMKGLLQSEPSLRKYLLAR